MDAAWQDMKNEKFLKIAMRTKYTPHPDFNFCMQHFSFS